MSTAERKRIVHYTKPSVHIPPSKQFSVTGRQPQSPQKSVDNLERIGVSVEQAAVMLSLSVRSIWVLIKDGRIKHTRFGTRVIVSVRSLDEFVNGKQEPAAVSENDDESQEDIE